MTSQLLKVTDVVRRDIELPNSLTRFHQTNANQEEIRPLHTSLYSSKAITKQRN